MEDNPFVMPGAVPDRDPGSYAVDGNSGVGDYAPPPPDDSKDPPPSAFSTEQEEAVAPPEVSSYRAVVGIAPDCAAEADGSAASRFAGQADLILAFAASAFFLVPGKASRRIGARLGKIGRVPVIAALALVALIFYSFRYPEFFGVASRGGIGVFGTLLFVAAAAAAVSSVALECVVFQKRRYVFLQSARLAVDGLSYLQNGLLLFAGTSVLFLFATESELALMACFATFFAASWVFFAASPPEKLAEYWKYGKAARSISLGVLGVLWGSAIVVAVSACAFAKYLREANVKVS
jgi:hypothetical protein